MQRTRGWTFWGAIVLACGMTLTGLIASAGAASKTPADELVLLEGPQMESLDPAICGSGNCGHIMRALYATLIDYDLDGNPVVPKLATSWKLADNKVDWIVQLRQDARFSNGSPITAAAVKASYDRYMDPKTGARRRSVFIKVLKEVSVVDSHTVKFTTFKPFPDMPHLLAFQEAGIVDAAVAKERGKAFGQNPVGSGPYKLHEWIRGQHAIVVPNEYYFGPKPRIKRLVYKSVPEGNARAFALSTGEADVVVNIPPEEAPLLAKNPDVVLRYQPVKLLLSYELNNTKKPFSDRRVRQALNYAVDKQAIIKNILGAGSISTSPACPGLQYRVSLPPYEYNPDKARQLLREAGYPNGFKMTIATPNGRYVKDRQVSEAVQAYLMAVGVQAEIKVYEWPPYIKLISSDPRTNPEKEMCMLGRSSPYMDYHLTRLYHSSNIKSGSSRTGYANPEVDRLIEAARFELNTEKRAALYDKLQRTIFEDAPFIWMYAQTKIYGFNKRVKGVTMVKGEERLRLEGAYKE